MEALSVMFSLKGDRIPATPKTQSELLATSDGSSGQCCDCCDCNDCSCDCKC